MKTPEETKAALEAFDEYLATTGLTPKDEQKRRFENIHKHKATIRRALTPQAVTGQGEKAGSDDDLLFRLEWWGNLDYKNGCEYAQQLLLDYRDRLHGLVAALLQQQPEGEKCEECQGAGEVFTHRMDCYDDLCALNGDIHSCTGVVVPCPSCATRPQQPAEEWKIPEGHALVPIEPTEEMLNAAFDSTSWPIDKQISAVTWAALRKNMATEYKAMLAAAPPTADVNEGENHEQ